jgi:flavin reductase (DIM6/NTAB) family NADH-FMN oxidoreductase RutF/rubredoxin
MNMKAIQKICYGVYIVGSKMGDKVNGQIVNTAFQITSDPPTMAVSINKQNLTHQFIMESKIFTLSILSKEASMSLIGQFGFKSGREIDKFSNVKHRIGVTGGPIVLEYTIGFMECEVLGTTDVGTHTIFIGKIVDCEVLSDDEPMTYAYYREIKGGKSPKTAPTYVKEEEPPKPQASPARYTCKVCGYVYDPEKGDPDNGIATGTAFDDLPDSWTCPICSAPKSEFERNAD